MKNWSTYALLGAGGRNPRVELLDPLDGTLTNLHAFAPGSSAYSIARSPDGEQIVIGTKTGSLTIWSSGGASEAGPEACATPRRLSHGSSPILDITFVAPRTVAVANAGGGCWLYDTNPGHHGVKNLHTAGRTICALCALGSDTLVGLATDGTSAFWNLHDCRVISTIRGPMPPAYVSLMRLHFWPEANALLYPSHTGHLVAIDAKTGKQREILAHSGPWYLLVIAGRQCLTFGAQDNLVKTWASDLTVTGPDVRSPSTVIAGGSVADDETSSLVLIAKDGTAGLYIVEGAQLQGLRQLPGKDYRVCVPPDSVAVAAQQSREARAEAERVVLDVQTKVSNAEDCGPQLDQLERLGYPHVSLALQADLAVKNEDLPAALRHSSALVKMLPPQSDKGQLSLFRLADLLERSWMFDEAAVVLRRVVAVNPALCPDQRLDRLTSCHEALLDPFAICEPDLPIPILCDCASEAGRRFQGRWLVKRRRTVIGQGIEVTAEQFATQYNHHRTEEGSHLPVAAAKPVFWISRQGVSKSVAVCFHDNTASREPVFELCMKFEKGGQQSVICPLVIYCIPTPEPGCDPREHNNGARDLYAQKTEQDAVKSRIKTTLAASIHLLRRMLTSELARKQTTTE